MRALDASFRRRRIGADDVDVQAAEGAAELRDAGPAVRLLPVVAEDPGFVAVQRDRLAMRLQIRAHRREVGECRFRLAEHERHQGTRGVVDEHQQRAATRPLLELLVVGAVDLNEFTETRSRRGCWMRGARRARGTHRPSAIIQYRSVSTERGTPCPSVNFSCASVGPNPSQRARTVARTSRRSADVSRR